MRWCAAIAVLAACGRPDIDPAPFERACSTTTCPSPYVCTKADYLLPAPGPEPLECFVPCGSDDDCAEGFDCNGHDGHGEADLGPPLGYCYRLSDTM